MIVDQATEKTLARVRALYRLAENNPSAAEAQAALDRARAILQAHNMAEIAIYDDAAEQRCRLGGASAVRETRAFREIWKKALALIVSAYYDVCCYCTTSIDGRHTIGLEIAFYGIDANARVAAIAYSSLAKQIEDLTQACAGKGRRAKVDYRMVLVDGFDRHLRLLREGESPACTALAVRAAAVAEAWLAEAEVQPETLYLQALRRPSAHYFHGVSDARRLTTAPLLAGGQNEED